MRCAQTPQLIDMFLNEIEVWVEKTYGRVRARLLLYSWTLKGIFANFEATLRIAQKWKEQQRHQDNLSSQDSQRHPASYCKDNERLLQKEEE